VLLLTLTLASLCSEPALGAESPAPLPPVRTWLESGRPAESIDVLVVGDGYVAADLVEDGPYWRDLERFSSRLLGELPFRSFRERFNIRASTLTSEESGCDPSPFRNAVNTALESYFDSSSGRVLKFRNATLLTELVRGTGEIDIVFVMVNTDRYGGSGSVLPDLLVRGRPCPAPVFAAGNADGIQIALHELGHSFAGLTDEYADPPLQRRYRLPWKRDIRHPNATRKGQFDASSREALRGSLKWSHFLDLPGAESYSWLHEGAYYREEDCFRPWETCMMRSSRDPFCPVCCEQMARNLTEACGDLWDPAQYHLDHPLSLWAR